MRNGNRRKAVSNYPGAAPLSAELGINIGCPDATGIAANDQDQLCQYGDFTYSYNLRGQLKSKSDGGVTSDYTYDGLGRLKQVSEPGMDLHYVHDALGRRIGKLRDGNLEKGWLYAVALNPIAQLDSTGNIEATFVYGTRAHVPDSMVMTDGTVYRLITDHLGSVRLVVNAVTGAVAQRLDYDAFGRVLNDTSPAACGNILESRRRICDGVDNTDGFLSGWRAQATGLTSVCFHSYPTSLAPSDPEVVPDTVGLVRVDLVGCLSDKRVMGHLGVVLPDVEIDELLELREAFKRMQVEPLMT